MQVLRRHESGMTTVSCSTPALPAALVQVRSASSDGIGHNTRVEALSGRICASVDADLISKIPRWPPSVQSGLVGG
jgi:hypothetical protein